MVAVRLEGIKKSYGLVEVLKGINFEIASGEFVVFVGPSGCGKSTLLRMIAGLEMPNSGEVFFGDKCFTSVPPAKRGVSMVFQSYALYPHMNVADNMTMSLRLAGVSKTNRWQRAVEVAKMLQLDTLLNRKPGELSGGQRQRVAIGRALVRQPDVFLFDEPLSNLDASLRVETRVSISKLHHSLKNTMIYVTHDQVEAMTMADRIVILDKGSVAQVGTPMELYHNPANAFVAGFIGSPKMNFIKVQELSRENGKIALALEGGEALNLDLTLSREAQTTELGIRPENIQVSNEGAISGRVVAVERLGSETLVYVETGAGTLISKANGEAPVKVGENTCLQFQSKHAYLFAADGTSILSRAPGERR